MTTNDSRRQENGSGKGWALSEADNGSGKGWASLEADNGPGKDWDLMVACMARRNVLRR